MKKLMMATLLLVVFALPALADGTQPPPPPPPPIEWTWNDGGITAMDSWMRTALTVALVADLP
jgi:opacity protein-like surface antigen